SAWLRKNWSAFLRQGALLLRVALLVDAKEGLPRVVGGRERPSSRCRCGRLCLRKTRPEVAALRCRLTARRSRRSRCTPASTSAVHSRSSTPWVFAFPSVEAKTLALCPDESLAAMSTTPRNALEPSLAAAPAR